MSVRGDWPPFYVWQRSHGLPLIARGPLRFRRDMDGMLALTSYDLRAALMPVMAEVGEAMNRAIEVFAEAMRIAGPIVMPYLTEDVVIESDVL